MNKKIIVSGCVNCPYLQIWNDGQGNGIDSIKSGQCKHPSFNKELPGVYMNSTVFISYDLEGKADGKANSPDTTTWCPLPNDKEEF